MTNEQWLIYIYGIYPEGGFQIFYIVLLAIFLITTFIILRSNYYDIVNANYNPRTSERFIPETKQLALEQTMYLRLGKLKYIVPSILLLLSFLCNLVPNKSTFMYIVAAPYVVDSTKSLIDSLQDPTSKAYKLNQLLDKGLDKAIQALDKPQTKDNNGK